MKSRIGTGVAFAGILALLVPAVASARPYGAGGSSSGSSLIGLAVNLGVGIGSDALFTQPPNVSVTVPGPTPGTSSTQTFSAAPWFMPSTGFGLRFYTTDQFSIEPQLELGFASMSLSSNGQSGSSSVFGVGLGAALRYDLVHHRSGQFYIGALPELSIFNYSPNQGDSTQGLGFEVKGLAGVEWTPAPEISNVSVGFEGQVPAIGYTQIKQGSVTSSTFGFILASPRLVVTLHYYF